jgi:hypothetical protein
MLCRVKRILLSNTYDIEDTFCTEYHSVIFLSRKKMFFFSGCEIVKGGEVEWQEYGRDTVRSPLDLTLTSLPLFPSPIGEGKRSARRAG